MILGLVILEVDQAFVMVLKVKVIGSVAIGVVFDLLNKAWISVFKGSCVNFFLFDIRENTHWWDVMYEEVRNDDGVIIARRFLPLRYDLHYTVIVWASKVFVEHKVFAVVLRCFSGMEMMLRDMLPSALAELPYEVLLTIGVGSKRSMFLNLGGELKVGFELIVTVLMSVLSDRFAALFVQQSVQVSVNLMPGADLVRIVSVTEQVFGKLVEEKAEQGSLL